MEHAGSQQGELRRGWAVVTGASSGLGRQFAIALAARASPVLAVARRAERLSALADEVASRGGRLEELRGGGVRVTAVAPGFVTTEFTDVAGSHAAERRLPHLKAENVVEAALRAHERGKSVKVVGGFYRFLTVAGRFAPRAVLARMMGRVVRPTSAPRAAGT